LNSQDFSKIGTVVVFGISGVGKTAACASFVSRHPEVSHTSAGSLLRIATAMTDDALRTGSPRAILKAQMLLGDALVAWRAQHKATAILIDAHSIIDNDEEIVEVPVEVVRSLQPTGLVLLEEPPELIAKRRASDERPRPVRSIDELRRQAALARNVCVRYAEELDLPLEVGSLSKEGSLDGLICRVASAF
jgi:adenylate kinase